MERAWQRPGEMCQDLPKPGCNMTAGGLQRKYSTFMFTYFNFNLSQIKLERSIIENK